MINRGRICGEMIGRMTREAGDRNDPTGVLELFFADTLGHSHESAIDTADALVQYLDTWGLALTPTLYLTELEANAGSGSALAQLPRTVLWGIVEEDGTVRAKFNAPARNPDGGIA